MTGNRILKLKNKIEEINKLNQFLMNFSLRHSLDPQICHSINLSLEEIFTNIVRYGFKNNHLHEINLYFKFKNNSLFISIEDDGIPFNPLKIAEPDLNVCLQERQVGGLGIHLLRSLMDQISYERKKNKNILTIEKNLIRKT